MSAGTNLQCSELIYQKIIPTIARTIAEKQLNHVIKENLLWALTNLIVDDNMSKNLALEDPSLLSNTMALLTDEKLDVISAKAIYYLTFTFPVAPYSYFSTV